MTDESWRSKQAAGNCLSVRVDFKFSYDIPALKIRNFTT